jgi:hypothetical protein
MVERVNNGYKYEWDWMFVNNIEYQGLGFITKVGTWQVKWTCQKRRQVLSKLNFDKCGV